MSFSDQDWLKPQDPGSGAPDQNEGNAPSVEPNPPDGHAYDIQKSPAAAGTAWFTVDSFDNYTDAGLAYQRYIAQGGYWQLLKDGKIISTTLPESERFKEGVEGQTDDGTPGTVPDTFKFGELDLSWLPPVVVAAAVLIVICAIVTGVPKELA